MSPYSSGYRRCHADDSSTNIDRWMLAHGGSVLKLDSLGRGKPDRLYGFRGDDLLVELKTGKKKLRDGQQAFKDTWRGKVYLWRTPADAESTLRSLGFAV